jgi:hypothetical protein
VGLLVVGLLVVGLLVEAEVEVLNPGCIQQVVLVVFPVATVLGVGHVGAGTEGLGSNQNPDCGLLKPVQIFQQLQLVAVTAVTIGIDTL